MFSKLDSRLKKEIKNKNFSRVRIFKDKVDEIEEDSEYLYEKIYDKFGTFIGLNDKEALKEIIKYSNEHNKLSKTDKLSDNSSTIIAKWNYLKPKLSEEEIKKIKENHPEFYNKYLLEKIKLSDKEVLKEIIKYYNEHN